MFLRSIKVLSKVILGCKVYKRKGAGKEAAAGVGFLFIVIVVFSPGIEKLRRK